MAPAHHKLELRLFNRLTWKHSKSGPNPKAVLDPFLADLPGGSGELNLFMNPL